jgi:hypothetical protein
MPDPARLHLATLAMVALPILAPPALATDGAREIHQACVATGCFPGDTAGWPVQIAEPGSYVLTSNLTLPDANTNAIIVNGKNVAIDLNGFAIQGPNVCDYGGGTCPSGGGTGIRQNLAGSGPVSIRNGTIDGMGETGIALNDAGLIEGLTVRNCGGDAISADRGVIRNNAVHNNNRGIRCAICVVRDNVASLNVGSGFVAGIQAHFVDNVAFNNRGWGIDTNGGNPTYVGNRLSGNDLGEIGPGAVELGLNFCDNDTTCP